MADSHNHNLTIDSGQLHKLNAIKPPKNDVTKLEILKSGQK